MPRTRKRTITVEVVYAKPDRHVAATVRVAHDASVGQAIAASRLLEQFPEIDLTRQAVGIYGARVRLTDTPADGDRIEIYRRLSKDPKQMRRERARRQRETNSERSRGRGRLGRL